MKRVEPQIQIQYVGHAIKNINANKIDFKMFLMIKTTFEWSTRKILHIVIKIIQHYLVGLLTLKV